MKNWLKSISLAALATLFWAVIGFSVTEVRYSEVESQIANSARMIAENTAKTTLIGTFIGIRFMKLLCRMTTISPITT